MPEDEDFPPVEFPITDELDLHTFHPKDVKSLIHEYIAECRRRGILRVRIVHGKGKSVLKKIVRSELRKNRSVVDFSDAGPGSGGWGATIVQLRK